MIKEAIVKIVSKEDLTYDEAYAVMNEIMSGETSPTQNAAFLASLSTKSAKAETTAEIAGCAAAMRDHATKVETGMDVFEIVGTGGDNAHSFNISTTAALVAASGGVKVAKHGNRAASSSSGTADCLEALGVNINQSPARCVELLKEVGMCFFFAQKYHSSMKYVGAIRRELGFRTVFNILGPLTNPASPSMQLLGVYDAYLVEPLAKFLQKSLVWNMRQVDAEFIAAEPAQQVRSAHGTLQAARQRLEHAIAHLMAIGIVDPLEIVDIEHHESTLFLRVALAQGRLHDMTDRAGIIDLRQAVELSPGAQVALLLHLLRNIDEQAYNGNQLPSFIVKTMTVGAINTEAAVRTLQLHLQRLALFRMHDLTNTLHAALHPLIPRIARNERVLIDLLRHLQKPRTAAGEIYHIRIQQILENIHIRGRQHPPVTLLVIPEQLSLMPHFSGANDEQHTQQCCSQPAITNQCHDKFPHKFHFPSHAISHL